MATFGEMQTYVSARLLDVNNIAVSASSVAGAINDAMRYWKYRRFWFNTADTTVTLVAEDPTIYLDSVTDFLVEMPMDDGFVIEYSGMRYPLQKRNPRDFDNIYLTQGYGLPEIYTIKSGVYSCYSIPDQAYDCRVYYLKQYTDLQANSDTNDFTDNANRLLCLWALANLHAELRQDDKMEAYYRAAAKDEYAQLGVMNMKVNSPGHLTLHSYL
jgi:hypothetical protein